MKECWYKNMTNLDLNLSDLGIKIPANRAVNLFKLKPTLTTEAIKKSEEIGLLNKCTNFRPNPKLMKLPAAPPLENPGLAATLKESAKPVPSRVKTSVLVDPREKDYVEDMEEDNIRLSDLDLTKYEKYSEGLVDPIAVDSDNLTFKTVTVPAKEAGTSFIDPGTAAKTQINTAGTKGKNQYFTVDIK